MKVQELHYGLQVIGDEVDGRIERVFVINKTTIGKKITVYELTHLNDVEARNKVEEIKHEAMARYLARRMAQAIA